MGRLVGCWLCQRRKWYIHLHWHKLHIQLYNPNILRYLGRIIHLGMGRLVVIDFCGLDRKHIRNC